MVTSPTCEYDASPLDTSLHHPPLPCPLAVIWHLSGYPDFWCYLILGREEHYEGKVAVILKNRTEFTGQGQKTRGLPCLLVTATRCPQQIMQENRRKLQKT